MGIAFAAQEPRRATCGYSRRIQFAHCFPNHHLPSPCSLSFAHTTLSCNKETYSAAPWVSLEVGCRFSEGKRITQQRMHQIPLPPVPTLLSLLHSQGGRRGILMASHTTISLSNLPLKISPFSCCCTVSPTVRIHVVLRHIFLS